MGSEVMAGEVAIVTGAGSGIGRATALLFAKQGAKVVVLDIDMEGGEATAHSICEAGGEAVFVSADVSQPREVREAIDRSVSKFGRPDAIVNVVGVSGRRWGDGPVDQCTEEAWDRVMDINLKSVFLCCKYVTKEMLAAGGGGAIVNVSSVLGLVGGDEDFATHAYATSKGGIISLTRSIASYYAPHGIRANVICPSLIETSMSERAQSDPGILERLPELQPLTGAFGRPDDVAHAALYLASGQSEFVTGTVLPVDGGWTVR